MASPADKAEGSVLIVIDDRGAVYLGPEGYLAGESDSGVVRSYVPGYTTPCRDMDELICRWWIFRHTPPSYESVLDYGRVSRLETEAEKKKELCPW